MPDQQMTIADILSGLLNAQKKVQIETRPWDQAPTFSGEASVPAFGGQLGVRGHYLKPDQYAPPDYSGMLTYRKEF